MTIRPEFLVRGLDGRPQPPLELVAKIQRYDPRLGLFYTNVSWAITETWKENDPRRVWIQNGEMQADMAFDICGYLPVTCSLDEAPAYIERELRSYTAEQFAGLRAAVNHWNDVEVEAQQESAVLGAVSDALDKSNDVSPGPSQPVLVDLKAETAPPPGDRMAKARAAKAAKRAANGSA